MYNVWTIANYLILLGLAKHRPLNPDKLNKLMYFVAACYLYESGGSALFNEEFKRWETGPVLYSINSRFRSDDYRPLTQPVDREQFEPSTIDPNIRGMIRHVYQNVGHYNGAKLKDMVLGEGLFQQYALDIVSKAAPDIGWGEMYQYFVDHPFDRIWED